jgi:hypothetical protein
MKKLIVMIGLCALGGTAQAADPQPATASPHAASKPAPQKAMDRLELEPTTITGNRELPKVMYVVPWKKADLGDLNGRPANSLLDEVLAPVDRDVFRREVAYFGVLALDSGSTRVPAAAAEK